MTRDQEAICALTGEVERLRTERDVMISVVAAACERVERAEARLAEAEALLLKFRGYRDGNVGDWHMDYYVWPRVEAFLSPAKAPDSSPVCSHDNCTSRSDGLTVTVICPECGWRVTGVIGQPWPKAPDSTPATP